MHKLVQVDWVDVTEVADWSTDIENPEFLSIGWTISDDDSPFVKLATTRALNKTCHESIDEKEVRRQEGTKQKAHRCKQQTFGLSNTFTSRPPRHKPRRSVCANGLGAP